VQCRKRRPDARAWQNCRITVITRTQFYGVGCALLAAGIVIACLWPFHSPRNQVSWLSGGGVRFGEHGTVISHTPIFPSAPLPQQGWTLEIWLQPENPWDSDTILAFYDPAHSRGFSLCQSDADLVLESKLWKEVEDEDHPGVPAFLARGALRRRGASFLTLASGPEGTRLYVDGSPVHVARRFRLSSDDFSGQLVVADSPVDNDSWSGELRGLAFYSGELSAAEIARHYTSWTGTGRPAVTQEDAPVAVYLFDEGSGNVIRNQISSGADLYIPDRYHEVHQSFLKRPWNEYYPGWGYWKNVLINIAGFVPLGFFMYGYMALTLRAQRAALVAILFGALLSLTVETIQAFLPTRDSGMTDIITNTLGTALGAGLCRCTSIVCAVIRDSPNVHVRRFAELFTSHPGEPEGITEHVS
jgi:hypothetical protein